MILCYVAGPFSAPTREGVEANIRKAERMGLEVAKLGLMPVIPHTNTSHPDFEHIQPYQFWVEGTLELLKACQVMILCEGWEKSSGSRGEKFYAATHGIAHFESIQDLKDWKKALGFTF